MNTERKKLSIAEIARDAETGLRALLLERPKAWVTEARARLHNLPKTNFDLGCDFADQGKWYDALFRFRIAAYFQPAYPQVWYNTGCCYYRLGKLKEAEAALKKAIAQKPDHAEAIFTLAAINPSAVGSAQPQQMPMEMVTAFFTSMAEGYDITEARNKYQGGKVMHELLRPLVPAASLQLVDLGCGTGIAARPWRSAARSILGVDCTPAMVALAQKASHEGKTLFDQLITADVGANPPGIAPATADVVLCVNVSPYLGALDGVMRTAAAALKPGGYFAITIEPHAAVQGFGLSPGSGRFTHSAAYVKQVASGAGFALAKEVRIALYGEASAQAFVFTKGL